MKPVPTPTPTGILAEDLIQAASMPCIRGSWYDLHKGQYKGCLLANLAWMNGFVRTRITSRRSRSSFLFPKYPILEAKVELFLIRIPSCYVDNLFQAIIGLHDAGAPLDHIISLVVGVEQDHSMRRKQPESPAESQSHPELVLVG